MADITIAQAVRVWVPRWRKNSDDLVVLRALARVLDSFRYDYGYNYNETRAAFCRAMGADDAVSASEFEDLSQDCEDLE